MEITIRQIVPPQATGFDWERWVSLTRAARQPNATARVSDKGAPVHPRSPVEK